MGAVSGWSLLLGAGGAVVLSAAFLMGVPAVAAGSAVTSRPAVAAAPEILRAAEQMMVPLVPAGGVVHDHPAGDESAANRSGAGSASVMVTDAASLGPLFITVIV